MSSTRQGLILRLQGGAEVQVDALKSTGTSNDLPAVSRGQAEADSKTKSRCAVSTKERGVSSFDWQLAVTVATMAT